MIVKKKELRDVLLLFMTKFYSKDLTRLLELCLSLSLAPTDGLRCMTVSIRESVLFVTNMASCSFPMKLCKVSAVLERCSVSNITKVAFQTFTLSLKDPLLLGNLSQVWE